MDTFNTLHKILVSLICLCMLLSGCKIDKRDNYIPPTQEELENVKPGTGHVVSETLIRGDWQKPELVVNKFGDLTNKTVVDIGAGFGYFVSYLVSKAEKVIAVDIDTTAIEILKMGKARYPEKTQNKIDIRLVEPDDPKIEDNEVDAVLIANTFAYIENKVAYLTNLRKGMKDNGVIVIVDFKMKKLKIDAPPPSDRMSLLETEEKLEQAGYRILESDDSSLDYQYIVVASLF